MNINTEIAAQMGSFMTMLKLVLVNLVNIWDCSAKTWGSISDGCGCVFFFENGELFARKKAVLKAAAWSKIYSRRSCHRGRKKKESVQNWMWCGWLQLCQLVPCSRWHREQPSGGVKMHWPRLTRLPPRQPPHRHLPPSPLNPAAAASICTSPRWNKRDMTGRGDLIEALEECALCLLGWEAVFSYDQYSCTDCCRGDENHRCNDSRVKP